MPQGALPFKYEQESQGTGMTALAGLPLYLDMAQVMRLRDSIEQHVGLRRGRQGWTDSELITSLILLNVAGGDCVEDLRVLESDEGFCQVLGHTRLSGLRRQERREQVGRWRKARERSVPSPSAVFRYLSQFSVVGQQAGISGRAHIPVPGPGLAGLSRVNADMLAFIDRCRRSEVATLDMDATLVETRKTTALFGYKGFRCYQPMNVWWAEQGLLVHTEFRDGNVPAGHEQLRVFKDSLRHLPNGVQRVRMRSDTAGYQHELLDYCDGGTDERFGRIEFAVGADVSPAFKNAVMEVAEEDWHDLKRKKGDHWESTGRQWAEVCFVPSAIGKCKQGREYRFLATREVLHEQRVLDGIGQEPSQPFPTMVQRGSRYKVFGIVTNMDWDGADLIRWFYERCGRSEEAHRAVKDDFAGGKLPTGGFYENAAWWWITVMAFNLNAIMKRLVMGDGWANRKMKAVRFSLIRIAGRVLNRSRCLILRLSKGHRAFAWILEIREKILRLSTA